MSVMGVSAFMLRDELIGGLGTLLPKSLSSTTLKAFSVGMVGFRWLHKGDDQHQCQSEMQTSQRARGKEFCTCTKQVAYGVKDLYGAISSCLLNSGMKLVLGIWDASGKAEFSGRVAG